MKSNAKVKQVNARRRRGQPVCVVFKDGSCCVGWITGVHLDQVSMKGSRTYRKPKAKIAGYIPGMVAGMFGPGDWDYNPFQFAGPPVAAAAAPPTAAGSTAGEGPGWVSSFGSFMGTMRKVWPDIQFGIGMVKTILPIMKGLKL